MKKFFLLLAVALSFTAYAETITNIEHGDKPGTVTKSWVMDILNKGTADNVVFMDARPVDYYNKKHTETIGWLDPDIFYEDDGCQKAIGMIPKDKIVVLICPGPRAEESYHNLTDSAATGACGYKGGNVYWIRTDVVYEKDRIIVK